MTSTSQTNRPRRTPQLPPVARPRAPTRRPNQALQIANSIAQGSVGDSDIADLRSQNEKLASMLANAMGKFFFMGGTVYAPSAKASISNGTVTLGSACSVSGTTIVLA